MRAFVPSVCLGTLLALGCATRSLDRGGAEPARSPEATTTAGGRHFSWEGALAKGQSLEIVNVGGSIRVERGASAKVEAQLSGSEDLRVAVAEHAGGATVCALHHEGDRCRAGGVDAATDERRAEGEVAFVITLPDGVGFTGRTAAGSIVTAPGLGSVTVTTVSG